VERVVFDVCELPAGEPTLDNRHPQAASASAPAPRSPGEPAPTTITS
jgi:hypothetical protein